MEETAAIGRRTFLLRLVLLGHAALGLALAVPAVAYVLSPLLAREGEGRWVPVPGGPPAKDDPPRRVELTTLETAGYTVQERRRAVWVVADPATGEPLVLSGTCTHLGCSFHWEDGAKHFACPCHGGRFDVTGRVLAGPPPRPLDRLPVKESDGLVFVMTGGEPPAPPRPPAPAPGTGKGTPTA